MERKTVIVLAVCFIVLIVNGVFLLDKNQSSFLFTAQVPLTGSIAVTILEPLVINITSPENITYNFTYSERMTSGAPDTENLYFQIILNATSNREIDNWTYTVLDNYSFSYFEEEPIVNLGTLYPWRQYENNLTVFAQPLSGIAGNDDVLFYVNLTSAAPEILSNDSEYLVCEGDSLTSAVLSVRDVNDDLDNIIINPNYDLFGQKSITELGNHLYAVALRSFYRLDARDVRTYQTTAVARDLDGQSSPEYPFNITVIELNDNPEITSPPSLPENESDYDVYIKLYLRGDHTTYNETWVITDEESGDLAGGNLTLNLTYINGSSFDLFEINSTTGVMFYEATNESPLGNYSLTLNVTDKPLDNPSENISYCSGADGSNNTISRNIYFVISNDNRAPVINSYYPEGSPLYVGGNDALYFNISFNDEDYDLLYANWFVGGRWLEQHDSLDYDSSDEFSYTFGCGISGWYNITASLSDGVQGGEVNQTWQVYVNEVACPESPSSGGGGGGGGVAFCYEDWICNDWATCQELTGSTKSGLIDSGDYQTFIEQCKQLGYEKENWGFQLRECYDSNECNNLEYRIDPPSSSQVCYYTENPSCNDNIKNCHDGSCEVAVDCGGPCSACPNCDDGLKNQNEEGIDCGGPCPHACEISSADIRPDILLILTILFILILLFVLYRIIVIIKRKKEKKEASRQEKIHDLFNQ